MKEENKGSKSSALIIGLMAVGIVCAFALGFMVKDLAFGKAGPGKGEAKPAGPGLEGGDTLGARFKALGDSLKEANLQALMDFKKDFKKMIFDRRVADMSSDLPVMLFDLNNLSGFAVNGPADARITLIEFSDFQCPFCSRMALFLEEVLKKESGNVRLIFIDRPLTTIHPYSYTAHEAGAEALAQGKFWEFYVYVFTNQNTLFPALTKDPDELAKNLKTFRDKLVEVAGTIGMDKDKMAQSLDNHSRKAELDKRIAVAERLDINTTPTVYANSFFMLGDPTIISKLIDNAARLQ
jgi:protein-disulfide isomerase